MDRGIISIISVGISESNRLIGFDLQAEDLMASVLLMEVELKMLWSGTMEYVGGEAAAHGPGFVFGNVGFGRFERGRLDQLISSLKNINL